MGAEAIASIVKDEAFEAINLDAAANAPPTPGVIEAISRCLVGGAANPSSGHFLGSRARDILEEARDALAAMIDGLTGDGVVFTSGCTEANNMVLKSAAFVPGVTVITSPVEHPSVLRPAEWLARRGVPVEQLGITREGIIDLDQLEGLLDRIEGPALLSVQVANSETGIVQPIEAMAHLVSRRPGILFHADAAQALGKLELRVGEPGSPHILTVSAHKVHGPMGLGALLMGDTLPLPVEPLLLGGEQEGGLRAGTQSVPLIAGWSEACREWQAESASLPERLRELRDVFEQTLLGRVSGAWVNGEGSPRLPNISNVTFPGVDGMALVAQLDAAGVAASQGSACSSRRPEPSPVLRAIGLNEAEAFASVRFSVSRLNRMSEVRRAAQIVAERALYLRGLT